MTRTRIEELAREKFADRKPEFPNVLHAERRELARLVLKFLEGYVPMVGGKAVSQRGKGKS